jgi:hypothetical protein
MRVPGSRGLQPAPGWGMLDSRMLHRSVAFTFACLVLAACGNSQNDAMGGGGGSAGSPPVGGGTGGVTTQPDADLPDADSTDGDTDAEPVDAGPTVIPYTALYADDALPTFELTIPPDCVDALAVTPDEYCQGSLIYRPGTPDGVDSTFEGVGIRLKGAASFRGLDGKAAFKVKVDEFMPGQRILGLRRLTLNNMVQDPSMVHERLGYRFYRAASVPAPLCNHARVYVNGEYYGLYANVQTLDDEFAEKLYSPAPGNLYDTPTGVYFLDLGRFDDHGFVLETNQTLNDTSDLAALITAVNGPIASFYQDAGLRLDWQEWLAAGAAQAIIADWDGYFGARNNYKLYHELARDRFLVLPWGIDQTFGITDSHSSDPLWHLGYALDGSTSERDPGHVFVQCQQSPACWSAYLDAVEAALAVWESLPLAQELDTILAQVDAARLADTRKEYRETETQQYLTALRTFLSDRAGRVRTDLATYGR